jgi:hypothetical protein
MARDQTAVLAHQRRRRPAPLLDARRDGRDLGIGVGPCVFRVRDQPIDRPTLDLVGRPRPLISRLDSRAGARAPRGRGRSGRGFILSVVPGTGCCCSGKGGRGKSSIENTCWEAVCFPRTAIGRFGFGIA